MIMTRFRRTGFRISCADALRGGLDTGVGCTSPDACRCDKVIEPFSLGHMMTSGVSGIWVPNPLHDTNA